MKRYSYGILAVVAILAMTTSAFATPLVNSAVLDFYIWADCDFMSVVTSNDNYATEVWIQDEYTCTSGADLHIFRLSEDDATAAVFNNGDSFRLAATLTITGTGQGEAGLQVAPWWSQDADGRFNVRTTDGEIACFGGRLPFYSFTGAHSLNYVKGDPIWLEIVYEAHSNTMADPATITYNLEYPIGVPYSSGPIPFDEGNPSEPYGTWGMLDDARVGGHIQIFGWEGAGLLRATWGDFSFDDLTPTSTESNSWGGVKTLFR